MRYLRYGMLAAVVVLLAASCSDETPTEGPVTLVNQVDFDGRPVVGTFEVTEGTDVIGCSSGTFEDGRVNQDTFDKVFTCESGSSEGTFTFHFSIANPPTGPGDDNGSWTVAEGSGEFVGLQGAGEWSVVYTADLPEGVETYTGTVEYTP